MTHRAKAFARVYDENLGRVYGYFGYRVGSVEEAEDLTQQAFERALGAWGTYDARRGTVATWLMAISSNLLVDHYRRSTARREDPVGGVLPEERSAQASEDDLRRELSPELEAALAALGEREREVIAIRFGAELTSREIAEVTGLTRANVQQICSRALRRLRAELDGSAVRPAVQSAAVGPTPTRSNATSPSRQSADAA